MKTRFIISYISVLLNASYLGLWSYVVSLHEQQHEQAKEHFDSLTLLPLYYREAFLISFSVYSIIVLGRSNRIVDKILFIVQIFMAVILIWQFL